MADELAAAVEAKTTTVVVGTTERRVPPPFHEQVAMIAEITKRERERQAALSKGEKK